MSAASASGTIGRDDSMDWVRLGRKLDRDSLQEWRPVDNQLTPEQAGRLAVIAVTADLEYWARTTSVDGYVGLNDLARTLDVIRRANAHDA